jgi:hypothetical protein
MKDFFNNLLSPQDGTISAKRFVGVFGFFILAFTMLANSFSHQEVAPSSDLVAAVQYIVIGALFGTSIDKFMGKK